MRKLIARSTEKTIFFKSIREGAAHFNMAVPSFVHYINNRDRHLKGFAIISIDDNGSDVVDKGIEGHGTLIRYDRRALECVTPCPYLESPKPKVGSSACMTCKYFEGKDREKRIVRCTHK